MPSSGVSEDSYSVLVINKSSKRKRKGKKCFTKYQYLTDIGHFRHAFIPEVA
ncbi:mCG147072 [Mus musculus]|jgi:hypothetical protein|nr:mCG147072 [Mus musculus]